MMFFQTPRNQLVRNRDLAGTYGRLNQRGSCDEQ